MKYISLNMIEGIIGYFIAKELGEVLNLTEPINITEKLIYYL
jgi:hypothetical protein